MYQHSMFLATIRNVLHILHLKNYHLCGYLLKFAVYCKDVLTYKCRDSHLSSVSVRDSSRRIELTSNALYVTIIILPKVSNDENEKHFAISTNPPISNNFKRNCSMVDAFFFDLC